MKIYIAGPYSDNPKRNTAMAEEFGKLLALKGHVVFIPHKMTYGWERDARFNYEDIMQMDFEWISICDAIFVIDKSPGTEREILFSQKRGLEIFTEIEKVPTIKRRNVEHEDPDH